MSSESGSAGATSGLKVVLLGDTAVGKSSLVSRYFTESFNEHTSSTIGAAFMSKDVRDSSGKLVKLEVWDTGGQERFRAMANLYYRNASAALVVYDITDASTFKAMAGWIKELDTKAPAGLTVVIVGNKLDLESERRVSTQVGEAFAARRQEVSGRPTLFVETSAKTGENVERTFSQLANCPVVTNSSTRSDIQLPPAGGKRRPLEKKKSGCC